MKEIINRQKDNLKDDIAQAFVTLSRSIVDKDPGTMCSVRHEYTQGNSFEVHVHALPVQPLLLHLYGIVLHIAIRAQLSLLFQIVGHSAHVQQCEFYDRC